MANKKPNLYKTAYGIEINSEFVKDIKGKDFVSYAGCIDVAHKTALKLKGRLVQLEGEILEIDASSCRFKTVFEIQDDAGKPLLRSFGYGEASQANMSSMVKSYPQSMAETRANARCFRTLCGIGLTSLEELYEESEKTIVNNLKNQIPNSEKPKPKTKMATYSVEEQKERTELSSAIKDFKASGKLRDDEFKNIMLSVNPKAKNTNEMTTEELKKAVALLDGSPETKSDSADLEKGDVTDLIGKTPKELRTELLKISSEKGISKVDMKRRGYDLYKENGGEEAFERFRMTKLTDVALLALCAEYRGA